MKPTVSHFDVAIVGAGPAGCATAFHLARRGRHVLLLDKCSFPRDKACGDGLTSTSVALLDEMGLSKMIKAHNQMAGVRVVTKRAGYKDFFYHKGSSRLISAGVVIPRYELDFMLTRKAVQSGAVLWEKSVATDLLFESGNVCGLRVRQDTSFWDVSADFVVVASGGASNIAKQAGLFVPDRCSVGMAMRGYYALPSSIPNFFQIYIPLSDTSDGRQIAGYGWVFPVTTSLVNIGVGYFPHNKTNYSLNLRHVFDSFLAQLRKINPCFAEIRLLGRVLGGCLPSSTEPELCQGRRVLLVGDAAGLIDPFTGEGINAALESGKMAAEVLEKALSTATPHTANLSDYSSMLESSFGERFRIRKNLVKTYGFTWKVLDETFHLEGLLFDSVRRAAIDYGTDGTDWLGELLSKHLEVIDQLGLETGISFVAERLNVILRTKNPLFSKIARRLLDRNRSFFHLSLAFLCHRLGGNGANDNAAEGATAVELAYLAFRIQGNVIDARPMEPQADNGKLTSETKWANMFTLMASDYLLVEANQILTDLDSEVKQLMSAATAEFCAGKLQQLKLVSDGTMTELDYLRLAEETTGTIFSLACSIGAKLGGAEQDVVNCLARFGRYLGVAYQLVQDGNEVMFESTTLQTHPFIESIRQKSPLFPLVWTYNLCPDNHLYHLMNKLYVEEDDIKACLETLRTNSSVTRAYECALSFQHLAKTVLNEIPTIPGKDDLLCLVDLLQQSQRGVATASFENLEICP